MSSGMNKSDLMRIISVKMEIPYQQAETAVNSFFAAMADGLAEGKRVEIRGFGSFQIREYDGYMGRNPKTGDDVSVAPKIQPFFKAGKEIKNVLNK